MPKYTVFILKIKRIPEVCIQAARDSILKKARPK
jgi:hypothetical protein